MLIKRFYLQLTCAMIFSGASAQFEGNALDFDGTNDMVEATVPAFIGNLNSTDFTFEGWVYPRGSVFSRILFAQSSTSNFATVSTGTSNQIYFYVVANGTNYSVVTNTNLTTNQWTHVAARWTASTQTVEVFFNGVLQAGIAGGTSSTGTNGLMVLGSRPGGAQYFNGKLDEVRVWNEARSLCEIQANMVNQITGVTSNLIANYSFNTGIGEGDNTGLTNLSDQSGSGNNGTLINFNLNGTSSNWVTSGATVTSSGLQLGGYSTSANTSVCAGSSYTFPDGSSQNNITAQVIYTCTISSINGCDSTITTTVDVAPSYQQNVTASVCYDASYTFPDGSSQNNITSQVIYTSNLLTVTGCDSIIQTTVDVLPVYQESESTTICSGESYTFPDGSTQNNITAQVIYTSNLQSINGCDSIVQTTVDVLPVYQENESATICSGESYTFPDGSTQTNITLQMVYTSNLQTVTGCDSIIVTTISLNTVETGISQNGNTLTAQANSAGYQWIDCATNMPIAGETAHSFTASQNGSYAVIVTENNCSDTSNCMSITTIGLEEQSIGQLVSYPNPTNGKIRLESTTTLAGINWQLTDISGKLVLSGTFTEVTPELDLSTCTNGIYLLQSEGLVSIRVIKE